MSRRSLSITDTNDTIILNTTRGITCMSDRLVDAGAGAPGTSRSVRYVKAPPRGPSQGLVRRLGLLALLAATALAIAAAPASAGLFSTYALPPAGQSCGNAALRYGPGARLPDCRAYEQASPIEKDGSDIQAAPNQVEAASNGGGITFFNSSGIHGGTGAANLPTYAAIRGDGEWATRGLLPPAGEGNLANFSGISGDFSTYFGQATLLSQGTVFNAYDTSGGPEKTIAPRRSFNFGNFAIAGMTDDGSKVLFEANQDAGQILPGAAPNVDNLYFWDQETGALSLAGVLTDSACGSPPCVDPAGAVAGPWNFWGGNNGNADDLREGGAIGAGGNSQYYTAPYHVLSNDGDRAFFSSGGQVYMRQGLTTASPSTVQISASQRGAPDATQPAIFRYATPSGSDVFFTSCAKLTDGATAVAGGSDVTGANNCRNLDDGQDLYVYHVSGPDAGQLEDLTVDDDDPLGADVRGVLGASDDGSYVYFVANTDLDGSGPASPGNCIGQNLGGGGQHCNLYAWHQGEVSFISPMNVNGSDQDASDSANYQVQSIAGGNARVQDTARVSSDGHILLFRAAAKLTDYDNHGVPQFYRYDADDSGSVECVSCNPTGVPPVGQPGFDSQTSFLDTSGSQFITPRFVSPDGNRVFFDSPDALVASDTNGSNGCPGTGARGIPACTDVYEWEADGSGSCTSSSTNGGCLYLISPGTGGPSVFGDASVSGDDAFIFTRDKLVAQDKDGLTDVYDVRVGGGLVSQHAVTLPPCSGDACQGAPVTPSAALPAASLTFTGPGNVVSTRQGKPKVSKPKTVTGTSVVLSVQLPSAGKLVISGSGLKKTLKTATKAGKYSIRLSLTVNARRTLKRKHQLSVKTRVVFAPSSGTSSTATVTLTFKAATTKRGH
jgi:hypothetical protein